MIRVSPDFDGVDTEDAAAVCDRILRELTRVPAFPLDGALPTVVVLPRWLEMQMGIMRHPHDPMSDRNLVQFMLDNYAGRGLHSFASDGEGDDEAREAEADKRLVDLLTSHPDAVMRGGWERAPMLLRPKTERPPGDKSPEDEQLPEGWTWSSQDPGQATGPDIVVGDERAHRFVAVVDGMLEFQHQCDSEPLDVVRAVLARHDRRHRERS